jgi:REP element-mobilizing transposase RayT
MRSCCPTVEADPAIIMHDHVHVLLRIPPNSAGDAPAVSPSEWIARFKSWTTYRWQKHVREDGWPDPGPRLWQRGFYDATIRSEDAIPAVQAYILDNPRRWMATYPDWRGGWPARNRD